MPGPRSPRSRSGWAPTACDNARSPSHRGVPLEIHNDALGYLVERGVLGLIGYIGFWVVVWKASRPGGLARMLIIGSLVQGMFRETFHYRHMWLIIALAFVMDGRKTDAEEAELAVEDEPDGADLQPAV